MSYRHRYYKYQSSELMFFVCLGVVGALFFIKPWQTINLPTIIVAIIVIVLVLLATAISAAKYFSFQKDKRQKMIHISLMSGEEFEKYLVQVLKHRGFSNIVLTPNQNDFGADILATKNKIRYAIQAKRYNGLVGVDSLYQCFGGQNYYKCDQVIVITNSKFTRTAVELAHKTGATLVDQDQLAEWVVDFQK